MVHVSLVILQVRAATGAGTGPWSEELPLGILCAVTVNVYVYYRFQVYMIV